MNAIDLFAGPGGWDEGVRDLNITPLGIEHDAAACATREAAGHRTLQADVAALNPADFAPCELFIGSPPCQAFSSAGKRDGQKDIDAILTVAAELMRGNDTRHAQTLHDPRSLLVVEPLRWALTLKPAHIALEQVPEVLPLWETFATHLQQLGYSTWTGLLRAEQYGVPQTRKRAFLIATTTGTTAPPPPTHRRYVPPRAESDAPTLFQPDDREPIVAPGEQHLKPWVSMAEALGWATTEKVGFRRRNDTDDGGFYRQRDLRDATAPALVLTEKSRSWIRVEERQQNGASRAIEEPAPTITSSMDNGNLRFMVNTGRAWKAGGSRDDAQTFDATEQPAPTIDGKGRWHVNGHEAIKRVELDEAAVLQGFPRSYPFQGSRTKRFEQVGNAIPPPLARAVIASLIR